MTSTPKIYVAGHRGMVGSAIVCTLQQQGQTHIVTRSYLRENDIVRFENTCGLSKN